MFTRSPKRGFSLVELLVVIAILGTLVALVVPAISMAGETSPGRSDRSSLEAIGFSLPTHAEARGACAASRPPCVSLAADLRAASQSASPPTLSMRWVNNAGSGPDFIPLDE